MLCPDCDCFVSHVLSCLVLFLASYLRDDQVTQLVGRGVFPEVNQTDPDGSTRYDGKQD